jgi:uncharacterized protein
MKESKYNFFYKLDNGSYLAFNALMTGLAVVDENTVEKITSHRDGTNPDFDEKMLKELRRGGFLCEDDFDEYGVLKIRRYMQQYPNQALGLTIAPTLDCNLACRYCYEDPDKKIMDETVRKGLVDYVSNYIEGGIKRLNIGWYGGEPLLCLNVIEHLSNELMTLCRKKRVKYTATIITNGTLLTLETVKKLKKWKVRNIQVTIDGYREIHDERRPFKAASSGSSFDRIMANLRTIAGKIPLALRINLDDTNKNQALEFIRQLRNEPVLGKQLGKTNGIYPYYGYIKKYTTSCRCSKEEVLKPGDFWQKDLELVKYHYKNMPGFQHYPDTSSGCVATAMQSFVVDPVGNLYKCWNHLGINEKSIGTLFEPLEVNSLMIKYLTESFENDTECKDCKVLPICMGGCVDVRVKVKSGEFERKDCASWKYYLEETIREYYLSKIKQMPDRQSAQQSNVAQKAG